MLKQTIIKQGIQQISYISNQNTSNRIGNSQEGQRWRLSYPATSNAIHNQVVQFKFNFFFKKKRKPINKKRKNKKKSETNKTRMDALKMSWRGVVEKLEATPSSQERAFWRLTPGAAEMMSPPTAKDAKVLRRRRAETGAMRADRDRFVAAAAAISELPR